MARCAIGGNAAMARDGPVAGRRRVGRLVHLAICMSAVVGTACGAATTSSQPSLTPTGSGTVQTPTPEPLLPGGLTLTRAVVTVDEYDIAPQQRRPYQMTFTSASDLAMIEQLLTRRQIALGQTVESCAGGLGWIVDLTRSDGSTVQLHLVDCGTSTATGDVLGLIEDLNQLRSGTTPTASP